MGSMLTSGENSLWGACGRVVKDLNMQLQVAEDLIRVNLTDNHDI